MPINPQTLGVAVGALVDQYPATAESAQHTVSVTLTSTPRAIAAPLRLEFEAAVGDTIVVGFNARFGAGTVDAVLDVATVGNNDTVINYLGDGLSGATAYGLPGWGAEDYERTATRKSGVTSYVVQADDVVNGKVTLVLWGKTKSSQRAIASDEAFPLTFEGVRLPRHAAEGGGGVSFVGDPLLVVGTQRPENPEVGTIFVNHSGVL